MRSLLRSFPPVVGAAMIFLAVHYFNFDPDTHLNGIWPWRKVAVVVGTAALCLIAATAAWIGNRAYPLKPTKRAVAACLSSYGLCILADCCAAQIDRFVSPQVQFWPQFVDMFAGFEYGLLGSLIFTFPITAFAAALMTFSYAQKL